MSISVRTLPRVSFIGRTICFRKFLFASLPDMGGQLARYKSVLEEQKRLGELLKAEGADFPGSDYDTTERKEWMDKLELHKVKIKDVVWPGTHDSATNRIGIRFVSRPFAQCQNHSIYRQLVRGIRVFDIRVEKNYHICHGILTGCKVDTVINDIKRFVSETKSEFMILQIRTEYQREDPPNFDKWLVEQLGDHLIAQDVHVFDKTLQELLPKRIICIWQPHKAQGKENLLWSSGYLKDNWTDTDLPYTKFQNNMNHLEKQPPAHSRQFFYRVENTCTPQANNPIVCVNPVTTRIKPYARLFISQAHKKGVGDRIQIFSSDFVDDDFINICIGATIARTAT